MLTLCFVSVFFWCLFHLASCGGGGNEVRNGCSSDDLTFFHDVSAQYVDLFLLSQNSGSLSSELETFMETAAIPELEYSILLQDVDYILYYLSRDIFLYGDPSTGSEGYVIDSRIAGDLWIYSNGGYGMCSKDGNTERATFIQRGGDNVRGPIEANGDGSSSSTNIIYLARVEWTFVKDKNGDSEGYKYWRIESVNTIAKVFGTFAL